MAICEVLGDVVDFDLDVDHAGVLLRDNSVVNFNLKSTSIDQSLEVMTPLERPGALQGIGQIQAIHSGDGFNLLVTDKEEVYCQLLRKDKKQELSAVMGQPLGLRKIQSISEIETISDYNSIQGTQVGALTAGSEGQSGRQVVHGAHVGWSALFLGKQPRRPTGHSALLSQPNESRIRHSAERELCERRCPRLDRQPAGLR